MIIVKFIVLFGCISVLSALQTYYCEICSNHTLCQYKMPGPSAACMSYDSTALLTNQEIKELVSKINERRNFIALGQSKILPQAANMKKIHWSTELARSAQRWADQCDPYLHPDREDNCRDLKNIEVGQNIGSVVGPSPGLNVKSFVEMWFIQILEYAGTVTYYNQSRDYNTNYFTQLIWAETEFIGCGKVKFYSHERKVMIERLICNFAPRGNIHGKSVYAIGYPGTQCAANMITKDEFKGLCDYKDSTLIRKLTTQKPSANSLLRILNLSNDPARHDIDPIRNNLRQTNLKKKRQRDQKIRHILTTVAHDAVHRAPLHKHNMRNGIIRNMSRSISDDDYLYQHERGHSHLYHGRPPPTFKPTMYQTTNYFQGNYNQDFRKYGYTTASVFFISSPNYRKNQHAQCTRKTGQIRNDCCDNMQCTRGYCHCQSTACQSETFTNPVLPDCSCSTVCPTTCPTVCPPIYTKGKCNCRCVPYGITRESFLSHNNMPNMMRSGNYKIKQELLAPDKEDEQLYVAEISKTLKTIAKNVKSKSFYEEMEDEFHPQYNEQDRDYLYRTFDTIRKKRQLKDEITLKPFWKLNELNNKKTPELKALQYTTLTNRKSRKTRRNMQSVFRTFTTEPITINIDDYSEDGNESQKTEKYLSFDELMYLRKFSDNYRSSNARRQATKATTKAPATTKAAATTKAPATTKATATTKAAATTKAPATTKAAVTTKAAATTKATTKAKATTKTTAETTPEFTANTPFIRKKHCTRKITCTWTEFTGSDDGKQRGPKDYGSKTPPGYVEGCTRTSTCTRDFMERNIFTPLSTTSPPDGRDRGTDRDGRITQPGEGGDDEEYCEKRSLKVRRQNTDNKNNNAISDKSSTLLLHSYTNTITESVPKVYDNYSKIKLKRHVKPPPNGDTTIMSYADLYYLVLNTIINSYGDRSHNATKCSCNCTSTHTSQYFIMICFVLYFII